MCMSDDLSRAAAVQGATWIWYPGDFEVWLGNIFNNRRTERGSMFPPFWKQDSHWPTVEFTTTVELTEDEQIRIAAEGQYNLAVDGKLQTSLLIPKGAHRISIKVWNQATPPALFVSGRTIHTDSCWRTTFEDKIWIDENGVAHGSGIYVPAASWHFDRIDTPPSGYRLEREERRPVCCHAMTTNPERGELYDFGRETFGYLKIKGLKGTVHIYYGESREEALDKEHCETLDVLSDTQGSASVASPVPLCSAPVASPVPLCSAPVASLVPLCSDLVAAPSRAFRYVYIEKEPDSHYDEVLMDYEYTPFDADRSGTFCCSDAQLNKIWEVSAYTLDLTTREFFMDGIKRDRWTWSGDAVQSYLMNYYLRFDTECVKRTIRQLRGKDPVTAHVNTIMDYTFYWFMSVSDYYHYTGDGEFVREMWPRMVTLMDYVLERTNADGMAEGKPDDWIFVDWVDFPMRKRGVLCFEQVLFVCALSAMEEAAHICGDDDKCDYYRKLAAALSVKLFDTFWSADRHALLHAIVDGQLDEQVTKFPNMFALLHILRPPLTPQSIGEEAAEELRHQIMQHVMLNPAVAPITTPYMRFYELEALCQMGHHTEVLKEIRDYWGGMLREGATTFWEKYVPTESGTQHLAMYGRPYGKSLCHAWGASPLYLLGRYYLGVSPLKPGYAEYEVRPQLGDLEWMRGDVPTPFGRIHVEMNRHSVTVRSDGGVGTLCVDGQRIKIEAGKEITITRKEE